MKPFLTDVIIVLGTYVVMFIAYKIGFRDGRNVTLKKLCGDNKPKSDL